MRNVFVLEIWCLSGFAINLRMCVSPGKSVVAALLRTEAQKDQDRICQRLVTIAALPVPV